VIPRILAAATAFLTLLAKLHLIHPAATVARFAVALVTVHPQALAAGVLAAATAACAVLAVLIVRSLAGNRVPRPNWSTA
jgi:hypothetical protein